MDCKHEQGIVIKSGLTVENVEELLSTMTAAPFYIRQSSEKGCYANFVIKCYAFRVQRSDNVFTFSFPHG
jgi:hypothetical protein